MPTVTLLPGNKRLKQIIQEHGASGWVILQNVDKCQAFDNRPASFVSKNNHQRWVLPENFKTDG